MTLENTDKQQYLIIFISEHVADDNDKVEFLFDAASIDVKRDEKLHELSR